MIFISDNCSKEKGKYSAASTLKKKGEQIITDTAGTPEALGVDRVYKAWREDFYGENWDITYMRVWFEDWRVVFEISQYPPPEWLSQYQEQQAGQ